MELAFTFDELVAKNMDKTQKELANFLQMVSSIDMEDSTDFNSTVLNFIDNVHIGKGYVYFGNFLKTSPPLKESKLFVDNALKIKA